MSKILSVLMVFGYFLTNDSTILLSAGLFMIAAEISDLKDFREVKYEE